MTATFDKYKKLLLNKNAELRLTKRRLHLAEKKIMYLEDLFKRKYYLHPTYQDLAINIRRILGKKKEKRKKWQTM
jgi:hypothetical protein